MRIEDLSEGKVTGTETAGKVALGICGTTESGVGISFVMGEGTVFLLHLLGDSVKFSSTISSKPKAGFTLSMLIETGFSFWIIVTVLLSLIETTLKGPMYLGFIWKVSRALTQTNLQEFKDSGTKVLYDVDEPKDGLVSEFKKCRLVEFRSSRGTSTLELKKASGKVVPVPKRRIAGVVPVAEWTVLRQPKRTKGNEDTQSAVIDRQRNELLRERWKRSIIPLVWGWYVVVCKCLKP